MVLYINYIVWYTSQYKGLRKLTVAPDDDFLLLCSIAEERNIYCSQAWTIRLFLLKSDFMVTQH